MSADLSFAAVAAKSPVAYPGNSPIIAPAFLIMAAAAVTAVTLMWPAPTR